MQFIHHAPVSIGRNYDFQAHELAFVADMDLRFTNQVDFQIARLIGCNLKSIVAGADLFDQDKAVAFAARVRGAMTMRVDQIEP